MEWASVADVEARWLDGALPVPALAVETLIGDAEDAVRAGLPEIDGLIAAGTVDKGRVVRVVARMVIRLLRNPQGIRTVQETTGHYGGSTTYAGDNLGEIVFTDQDRRELLGKPVARGRRAFTITPGGVA